jgi:hypothetical protein
MKVLIVGCGAVGQVFGVSLQKAGVELGLYDRPATLVKLEQALVDEGLPLFQVRRRGRAPLAHRLKNYQVIADPVAARRFGPDQIWFTVPSPVYYSEWFKEFLREVPSRRVVCFVPEGGRPEFFPEGDPDRLVFGGTTFMAWQGGPEAGGGQPGGVNFWLPPMAIPLMGAKEACREVGQPLQQAGFKVTLGKPDSPQQACVTAVITAFMAGLELSGWSLAAFRKGPWLTQAAGASSQAVLSQLPVAGIFTKALLGVPVLSVGLYLAAFLMPVLVPFDLEKYLKFHYLKTRLQTLALLELFAADGMKRNLPVETIRRLQQQLIATPG